MRRSPPPRPPTASRTPHRGAAFLSLAAALLAAGPAIAQDKVEVTVIPKGQSWSVGGKGGAPCEPACTMFLAPDKYEVVMNESKMTLLLQVPTEITYEPGAPRLRTVAGWTAIGGVGIGGLFVGFGAYGLLQSCAHTGGCPGGLTVSRPVAEALVMTAAGLISVSVAGAIVFAISGEGIGIRELAPVPDPPRRKSFDVMLRPSSGGATLAVAHRF